MRRAYLTLLSMVLFASPWAAVVAQTYPAKPIRLIVGFPPGGSVDTIARHLGQKLGDSLRQPVVVDNRPGAAGTIAAELVAKSAPDGYTLFMQDIPTHAINASYYKKLSYDAVADFSSVMLVASTPIVLVANPAFPANSIAQLVEQARSNPGRINFASGGNGSSTHLAGELLKMAASIDMTHVPYKGAPLAMADVVSGQVQLLFSSLPGALSLVRANKLKAIAVGSTRRSGTAPEIPTVAEAGFPDYEASQRFGLLAPASLPRQIVDRLNAEALQALRSPEVLQTLSKQGYEPIGGSPAELESDLKAETAKWARVVRTANVRAD